MIPVPPTLAGIAVAIQSALWSLTLVIVPTLATYIAFSDSPEFANGDWWQATVVGLRIWLLGHGGELAVGGDVPGVISLVPLGLPLLFGFFAKVIARRSGQASASCALTAVGVYTALVVLMAIVVGNGGVSLIRAIGVTVLTIGIGVLWGLAGLPESVDALRSIRAAWSRLPVGVRAGVRDALVLTAMILIGGLIVITWWTARNTGNVGALISGLYTDPVTVVTLVLSQIIFIPNLLIWAIGWAAGPGFQVGSDSLITTAQVSVGPLPPMPILGVLPDSRFAGDFFILLPLVFVAMALAWSLVIGRKYTLAQWKVLATRIATGAGVTVLVLMLLTGLARGAAGPMPLDVIGSQSLAVGRAVLGWMLCGYAVAAIAWTLPQINAVREIFRRTPGETSDS